MYEVVNQGRWYDTCTATYDLFFYDFLSNFDHCSEVGLSTQSVYGVMESDLDLKSQSITFAKQQGWINCTTTSSPTTSSSTTNNPSQFQVGDQTCWYGMNAQIVADNGDGTYDINSNGSISYNITASALGTDINGNQTNNCGAEATTTYNPSYNSGTTSDQSGDVYQAGDSISFSAKAPLGTNPNNYFDYSGVIMSVNPQNDSSTQYYVEVTSTNDPDLANQLPVYISWNDMAETIGY